MSKSKASSEINESLMAILLVVCFIALFFCPGFPSSTTLTANAITPCSCGGFGVNLHPDDVEWMGNPPPSPCGEQAN